MKRKLGRAGSFTVERVWQFMFVLLLFFCFSIELLI